MNISARIFAFILALSGGAASFVYWLAWTRRFVFFVGESKMVAAALALLFLFGLNVGTWIWRYARDLNTRANLSEVAGLAAASCIYDFVSVPTFHAIEHLYVLATWWPSHRILFFAASFAVAVLVVLPPAVLAGALLRSIIGWIVSEITAFAISAAGAALEAAVMCDLKPITAGP